MHRVLSKSQISYCANLSNRSGSCWIDVLELIVVTASSGVVQTWLLRQTIPADLALRELLRVCPLRFRGGFYLEPVGCLPRGSGSLVILLADTNSTPRFI